MPRHCLPAYRSVVALSLSGFLSPRAHRACFTPLTRFVGVGQCVIDGRQHVVFRSRQLHWSFGRGIPWPSRHGAAGPVFASMILADYLSLERKTYLVSF